VTKLGVSGYELKPFREKDLVAMAAAVVPLQKKEAATVSQP
jgi:hypothetical protein